MHRQVLCVLAASEAGCPVPLRVVTVAATTVLHFLFVGMPVTIAPFSSHPPAAALTTREQGRSAGAVLA